MKSSVALLALLVFAVTPAGLAQWLQTGGPEGGYITALAEDDSFLYAGTWGQIFRMRHGETAWTPVSALAPWEISATCLVTRGVALIAGTPGAGVFWSSDHGMTDLFAEIDSAGVALSTDGGASWTSVNTGLTDTTVRCLAVVDTLLFAGNGSGVFLSTNRGMNWASVSTGLIDRTVQCFAVSGGTLFAGTEHGGVFRTNDRGASWTAVNNGLSSPGVTCMEAQGTRIFAAGDRRGEVFLSENSGDTWSPVDTGMIYLQVLVLEASDSALFAGTHGAGVWRRPLREEVKFYGSGLSSGVYSYRLQAEDFVKTCKLILLK
jgi:hypothetical protein